ncbi:MAG: hypothetical protein HEEMFOPI_01222 [Holosporales bacterium]
MALLLDGSKTTLAKTYLKIDESFSRQNYFDLEKTIDRQRLLDPYQNLERATVDWPRLNGIRKNIPNTAMFICMYVRKEALFFS